MSSAGLGSLFPLLVVNQSVVYTQFGTIEVLTSEYRSFVELPYLTLVILATQSTDSIKYIT